MPKQKKGKVSQKIARKRSSRKKLVRKRPNQLSKVERLDRELGISWRLS